jgi:hypothetical protein
MLALVRSLLLINSSMIAGGIGNCDLGEEQRTLYIFVSISIGYFEAPRGYVFIHLGAHLFFTLRVALMSQNINNS